jgi:hypothetical protein
LHLFLLIYNSNLKSPEEASSHSHCTLICAHIFHPFTSTPQLSFFNLKKATFFSLSFLFEKSTNVCSLKPPYLWEKQAPCFLRTSDFW